MRKIPFLLTLFVLFASMAGAQGSRKDDVALGARGPVSNASVAVCTQPATTTTTPCSTLATLYTDLTLGTPAPNPVTADALGNYHFYAPVGKYTIQIYGPQISPAFVMTDVILGCDPTNCQMTTLTVSGLTPGRCLQSGSGGLIVVAAGACTTGAGTVGGSTVNGKVAVGTTANNIQAYTNFSYDGTTLTLPQESLGGSQNLTGVQGNAAKVQAAGTNSGATGAILCNDANGNATTSGCPSSDKTVSLFCPSGDLGGNVSVTANTDTTVTTIACTTPSSGGSWRFFLSYSMYWLTASATNCDFWITDDQGNAAFAGSESTIAFGTIHAGASWAGYSLATYANSVTVTFTLHARSSAASTIFAAQQRAGAVNSNMQASVATSN